MRGYGLLGAIAVLLAGCGPQERAAGPSANESDVAPAGPVSAAPPPAPAPAPAERPPRPEAKEDAIPAAYHGLYESSKEACGQPSDGRLAVSAGELRFHESIGTVRKVVPEPSGAIRVEADYQGEGESWRSTHRLSLSEGGAALTVSGEGTSMVRRRCPAGEL